MKRTGKKRHEEGLLTRDAECVCARSIRNRLLHNTRPFCVLAIHTLELEDLYNNWYEMKLEGQMTKEMGIEQSNERWELAKKGGIPRQKAITTDGVLAEAMG